MPSIKKPASIGRVTHFFSKIKVAIIKFKKPIKTGVKIHILGATTDFKMPVGSMEYDHEKISIAKKGKEVGMRVKYGVREGDEIFEVK